MVLVVVALVVVLLVLAALDLGRALVSVFDGEVGSTVGFDLSVCFPNGVPIPFFADGDAVRFLFLSGTLPMPSGSAGMPERNFASASSHGSSSAKALVHRGPVQQGWFA